MKLYKSNSNWGSGLRTVHVTLKYYIKARKVLHDELIMISSKGIGVLRCISVSYRILGSQDFRSSESFRNINHVVE